MGKELDGAIHFDGLSRPVCPSIYLSICPSVCLLVCPCTLACLPLWPSVGLSVSQVVLQVSHRGLLLTATADCSWLIWVLNFISLVRI